MKKLLILFSLFFSNALFSTPSERVIGIEGKYRVNPSGSFSYEIPLVLPTSPNGVEPEMSLQYQSSNDDGIAGEFWHLAGVSSITRCPSTMYEDSVIRNVRFDYEDRFCLGGSKLYAISGEYGKDGTEYRVQNDRSIKIVSHGQSGFGPLFFQVYLKNGRIREYGNYVGNQYRSDDDTVYSWKITRSSDRKRSKYPI